VLFLRRFLWDSFRTASRNEIATIGACSLMTGSAMVLTFQIAVALAKVPACWQFCCTIGGSTCLFAERIGRHSCARIIEDQKRIRIVRVISRMMFFYISGFSNLDTMALDYEGGECCSRSKPANPGQACQITRPVIDGVHWSLFSISSGALAKNSWNVEVGADHVMLRTLSD